MPRFLGLRGNRLNWVALLGVTMPAVMLFGYNTSLLGGVLTLDSFDHQFPQIDVTDVDTNPVEIRQRSTIQGTVVALYVVGGLLGALSCIGLGDILGRRRVIVIASAVQVVGAVLMASAFAFAQLVASRVIVGLGTGGLLATVPIWQSEISATDNRGAHVAATGAFAGAGAMLTLFVDFGMSFAPGSISWRLPFALQTLLSTSVVTFIAVLPESPRWLLRQKRENEAREVLAALNDVLLNSRKVQTEVEEVQLSLRLAGNASVGQIFRMGPQRVFHRAMLAISVMAFVQFTGVNVITFYTNTIFERYLMLDSVKSRILAAIYQMVSPLGGVLCFFTIEGFGRRGLMLASAAGNAICMALVAGLGSQPQNSMAMHGAVVFMFIYHFTFVMGLGSVPFIYMAEIAPLTLRATINGISIGVFWAFAFILAEVSPVAFEAIGWRYFLIFAGLNVVMMGLVYMLFPETAGHSLEEVDQIFISSNSIWDSVWVAKRLSRSDSKNPECAEKDQQGQKVGV